MLDKFGAIFLLVVCGYAVEAKIEITNLNVPSTVRSGGNDEVILDCDYEIDDEDKEGLEVKWFFDQDKPIYQWIPNTNRPPQALGFLKKRIDVSYKVSDDENEMYRALRIKDIEPDLSGEYTCKVSSFRNEAVQTKNLIVYEPASEFELVHIDDSNTVICSVSGVFPEPKLKVYILGLDKNATKVKLEDDEDDDDGDENDNGIPDELEEEPSSTEDDDEVERTEDNLYNVTSSLSYNESDLTEETVFVCDVWIPNTTYRDTRKLDYYQGDVSTTSETQIESDYNTDNDYSTISTNTAEADNASQTALASTFFLAIAILLHLIVH